MALKRPAGRCCGVAVSWTVTEVSSLQARSSRWTGRRRVRRVPAGQPSHLRLRLSATAAAVGPEDSCLYARAGRVCS